MSEEYEPQDYHSMSRDELKNSEGAVVETFEFSIDAHGNFSTQDPNLPPSSPLSNNTPVENKVEVEDNQSEINHDSDEEAMSDSVSMSMEDLINWEENVDKEEEVIENSEEEEFEDDGEGEVDTDVEVDEEKAELQKKIQEMEQRERIREVFSDLETKYSKEEMVMPQISKYEYMTLAKEYVENGSLSEDTYKSLSEKNYSKEFVDNYITTELAKQMPEQPVVEKAEYNHENTVAEFAKEMNMEVSEFNELFNDFSTNVNQDTIKHFESLTPEKQMIALQQYQIQKLNFENKQKQEKPRRLKKSVNQGRKGNTQKALSIEDMEKGLSRAIQRNDSAEINKYNKMLEKAGYNMSL